MRNFSLLIASVLMVWIAVFSGSIAGARVLRVPAGFPSIQEAVDAAGETDTVLVAPGTYFESVLVDDKSLLLVSEAGPEETVIDGDGVERVIELAGYRDALPTLAGFTIRGGDGGREDGAGIHIGSAATVRECIVTDCLADYSKGAVIWCDSGPATIVDTRIVNNEANFAAINVDCYSAVPSVERCTISGNTGSAIRSECRYTTSPTFTVRSCTIVDNRNGIVSAPESAHIERSIVAFNEGTGISGIDHGPILHHNLVFGNGVDYSGAAEPGRLDLRIDPHLLGPKHDYAPSKISPAVDAGDPSLPIGPRDGPRADLGALEAPHLDPAPLALSFDPPETLIAIGSSARVSLLIANRTPRSLESTLLVRADGGLAEPRESVVSLAPHQSLRLPIEVVAPDSLRPGDYVVTARVLTADPLPLAGGAILDLEIWNEPRAWRVPDDFPTIQDAIDAADDGDTVLVSPGTWEEGLKIIGKWIKLLSTEGPDTTVILPPHWKRGIECERVGNDMEIRGFTVRNASYNGSGAGLSLFETDALIAACIVENCEAWGWHHDGGGMWLGTGYVRVEGCVVRNNSSSYHGGGIYSSWRENAVITGCVVVDNETVVTGGGIRGGRRIEGNTVARNAIRPDWLYELPEPGAGSDLGKTTDYYGSGIASADSVIGNEVRDNEGGDSSLTGGNCVAGNLVLNGSRGGIEAWPGPISNNIVAYCAGDGIYARGSHADMIGNILYRNAQSGILQSGNYAFEITNNALIENGMYGILSSDSPSARIHHNAFDGNIVDPYWGFDADSTQVYGDPLFFDPATLDFRLLPDSPLIDTGDPDRIDPDGTRSDIGITPYDHSGDARLYLSPDREQARPGERVFLRVMLASHVDSPRAYEIEDGVLTPSGDVLRPHRIHVVLGPRATALRTLEWRVLVDAETGVYEIGARAAPGVTDRFQIEVISP